MHFVGALIRSMEYSPSWEANRFSASQEIPRILWNRKVHYWPRDLRRSRSAAARLLRMWVRIPPWCSSVVSVVCSQRSLWRDNHSSRGVLPTVVCRVWSRNLVHEGAPAHWWAVVSGGKKKLHYRVHKCPPTVPNLSQLDPVHTPHIQLPEDPS